MKIKKIAVMVMVMVGLVALLATTGFALEYQCTVTMAGSGGTTYSYVKLTDTAGTPAFTDRMFTFPTTRAKEMLAVALTAMANNKRVRVVTPSNVQWTTITALYLLPN